MPYIYGPEPKLAKAAKHTNSHLPIAVKRAINNIVIALNSVVIGTSPSCSSAQQKSYLYRSTVYSKVLWCQMFLHAFHFILYFAKTIAIDQRRGTKKKSETRKLVSICRLWSDVQTHPKKKQIESSQLRITSNDFGIQTQHVKSSPWLELVPNWVLRCEKLFGCLRSSDARVHCSIEMSQ